MEKLETHLRRWVSFFEKKDSFYFKRIILIEINYWGVQDE